MTERRVTRSQTLINGGGKQARLHRRERYVIKRGAGGKRHGREFSVSSNEVEIGSELDGGIIDSKNVLPPDTKRRAAVNSGTPGPIVQGQGGSKRIRRSLTSCGEPQGNIENDQRISGEHEGVCLPSIRQKATAKPPGGNQIFGDDQNHDNINNNNNNNDEDGDDDDYDDDYNDNHHNKESHKMSESASTASATNTADNSQEVGSLTTRVRIISLMRSLRCRIEHLERDLERMIKGFDRVREDLDQLKEDLPQAYADMEELQKLLFPTR